MKRLIKWLFILVVLVVALVVGLLLSKDAILKAAVEQQIRAQTGMDVEIGRLSLGLLSPVVTIENLTLRNTPEFGGTPFLDIRELHLEYDRDALKQRKLKIQLLRLNLEELTVVRNSAGTTNISLLSTQRPTGPTRLAGDIDFYGVDVLNLSLGKVQLIDLKEPRNNRIRNVNLQNQIFHNVRTPGDLYGVLVLLWMRSGGSSIISGNIPFPGQVMCQPVTKQALSKHLLAKDA